MYLKIQNSGVAPVESFVVLGVSTARNDSKKIGQFGSGSKHGINVLIRKNNVPVIFLGEEELKFSTQKAKMGEKDFHHVIYDFRGKTEKTGFSLEFGEMDWDNVHMALREFISNAIDQVGAENVTMELVEEAVPVKDATCIYVKLTQEIKEYYDNINKYFLHFNNLENESLIKKEKTSPCRIYRMGVFVREIEMNSVFDYNFDETVKIDESRNMDSGSCLNPCSRILGLSELGLQEYYKTFNNSESLYEDKFYSWHFSAHEAEKAWKKVYNEKLLCTDERVKTLVARRGYKCLIPARKVIETYVPNAKDFVTKIENNGCEIVPANKETQKNFNKVWRKLETYNLTNNKLKPELRSFIQIVKDGQQLRGYYANEVVYINVDDQGSFQTILEEVAHYVTGAEDCTRDFQEFLTLFACRATGWI